MASDPPDPRKGGCVEVSHQGMMELQLASADGTIVVNTVTGEVCPLHQQVATGVVSATDAAMHFSPEGFAYVAQGGTATWVAHLLRKSVWDDPSGKRFVFELTPSGYEARWLDDLRSAWSMAFLTWKASGDSAAKICCSVHTSDQPAAGEASVVICSWSCRHLAVTPLVCG